MASSTSTNSASRGGLSRRAAAALKSARRTSDDDLIRQVLGPRNEHFVKHPLDGKTILGAIPQPVEPPRAQSDPITVLTANDDPAGKADWFKGTGFEGKQSSPPKATEPKPRSKMTLAEAAAAATVSTQAAQALGIDILTGLPGEQVERIADAVNTRPPNTY